MVFDPVHQVMRRLTAAEGYLELGLPAESLAELQQAENTEIFEGPYLWLMGQALRNQGRYDEAIAPLRRAMRLLHRDAEKQAWAALKECLEKSGRSADAADMMRTMEFMEEGSTDECQLELNPEDSMDSTPTICIQIPNLGKLQINIHSEDGLTIEMISSTVNENSDEQS